MHFLRYLSRQGEVFLHPGSQKLTTWMLQQMSNGMNILEIGCGTGAMLVEAASHFKVKLTGADISKHMLKTARQRLMYCGLNSKVDLCLLKADGKLPFPDEHFSMVCAESVLAICDENILPVLLNEVRRVLKPGGLLLSNDAIWKTGTSDAHIQQINKQCLADFGMIQSLGSPATVNDWTTAFEQTGLLVKDAILVTPAMLHRITEWSMNKRSVWFTQLKRFSARIGPLHLFRRRKYALRLASHAKDGAMLDNYLFVVQKPEA